MHRLVIEDPDGGGRRIIDATNWTMWTSSNYPGAKLGTLLLPWNQIQRCRGRSGEAPDRQTKVDGSSVPMSSTRSPAYNQQNIDMFTQQQYRTGRPLPPLPSRSRGRQLPDIPGGLRSPHLYGRPLPPIPEVDRPRIKRRPSGQMPTIPEAGRFILPSRPLPPPPHMMGRPLPTPPHVMGRPLPQPPHMMGRPLPPLPHMMGRPLSPQPHMMGRPLPTPPHRMGRPLHPPPHMMGRPLPTQQPVADKHSLGRPLPQVPSQSDSKLWHSTLPGTADSNSEKAELTYEDIKNDVLNRARKIKDIKNKKGEELISMNKQKALIRVEKLKKRKEELAKKKSKQEKENPTQCDTINKKIREMFVVTLNDIRRDIFELTKLLQYKLEKQRAYVNKVEQERIILNAAKTTVFLKIYRNNDDLESIERLMSHMDKSDTVYFKEDWREIMAKQRLRLDIIKSIKYKRKRLKRLCITGDIQCSDDVNVIVNLIRKLKANSKSIQTLRDIFIRQCLDKDEEWQLELENEMLDLEEEFQEVDPETLARINRVANRTADDIRREEQDKERKERELYDDKIRNMKKSLENTKQDYFTHLKIRRELGEGKEKTRSDVGVEEGRSTEPPLNKRMRKLLKQQKKKWSKLEKQCAKHPRILEKKRLSKLKREQRLKALRGLLSWKRLENCMINSAYYRARQHVTKFTVKQRNRLRQMKFSIILKLQTMKRTFSSAKQRGLQSRPVIRFRKMYKQIKGQIDTAKTRITKGIRKNATSAANKISRVAKNTGNKMSNVARCAGRKISKAAVYTGKKTDTALNKVYKQYTKIMKPPPPVRTKQRSTQKSVIGDNAIKRYIDALITAVHFRNATVFKLKQNRIVPPRVKDIDYDDSPSYVAFSNNRDRAARQHRRFRAAQSSMSLNELLSGMKKPHLPVLNAKVKHGSEIYLQYEEKLGRKLTLQEKRDVEQRMWKLRRDAIQQDIYEYFKNNTFNFTKVLKKLRRANPLLPIDVYAEYVESFLVDDLISSSDSFLSEYFSESKRKASEYKSQLKDRSSHRFHKNDDSRLSYQMKRSNMDYSPRQMQRTRKRRRKRRPQKPDTLSSDIDSTTDIEETRTIPKSNRKKSYDRIVSKSKNTSHKKLRDNGKQKKGKVRQSKVDKKSSKNDTKKSSKTETKKSSKNNTKKSSKTETKQSSETETNKRKKRVISKKPKTSQKSQRSGKSLYKRSSSSASSNQSSSDNMGLFLRNKHQTKGRSTNKRKIKSTKSDQRSQSWWSRIVSGFKQHKPRDGRKSEAPDPKVQSDKSVQENKVKKDVSKAKKNDSTSKFSLTEMREKGKLKKTKKSKKKAKHTVNEKLFHNNDLQSSDSRHKSSSESNDKNVKIRKNALSKISQLFFGHKHKNMSKARKESKQKKSEDKKKSSKYSSSKDLSKSLKKNLRTKRKMYATRNHHINRKGRLTGRSSWTEIQRSRNRKAKKGTFKNDPKRSTSTKRLDKKSSKRSKGPGRRSFWNILARKHKGNIKKTVSFDFDKRTKRKTENEKLSRHSGQISNKSVRRSVMKKKRTPTIRPKSPYSSGSEYDKKSSSSTPSMTSSSTTATDADVKGSVPSQQSSSSKRMSRSRMRRIASKIETPSSVSTKRERRTNRIRRALSESFTRIRSRLKKQNREPVLETDSSSVTSMPPVVISPSTQAMRGSISSLNEIRSFKNRLKDSFRNLRKREKKSDDKETAKPKIIKSILKKEKRSLKKRLGDSFGKLRPNKNKRKKQKQEKISLHEFPPPSLKTRMRNSFRKLRKWRNPDETTSSPSISDYEPDRPRLKPFFKPKNSWIDESSSDSTRKKSFRSRIRDSFRRLRIKKPRRRESILTRVIDRSSSSTVRHKPRTLRTLFRKKRKTKSSPSFNKNISSHQEAVNNDIVGKEDNTQNYSNTRSSVRVKMSNLFKKFRKTKTNNEVVKEETWDAESISSSDMSDIQSEHSNDI